MVDDSNPTAAQLEALKVADLKSMCKDAGLKISGRKQELMMKMKSYYLRKKRLATSQLKSWPKLRKKFLRPKSMLQN